MTLPAMHCPEKGTALAYAQGALKPAAAADFERHAEACAGCREEARDAAALLARLKEWPAREPTRDLTVEVLGRLAAAERAPVWRRFVPAACAAAVLLLLAGGFGWWSRHEPRRLAIRQASRWLVTAQRPDGSWGGTGKAGEPYSFALTGLGLLAALDLPRDAGLGEACEKAAGWLMQHQAPDGRLGAAFSGMPYNQGIGTLALLKWCAQKPGATLPHGVARAVNLILERQDSSGGWGYSEGDPTPNVSITIWQLQALRQAETMGLAEVKPALGRGLRWLRTNRNGDGLYGYRKPEDYPAGSEALTAMSVFCELDCDGRAGDRGDIRRSIGEILRQAAGDAPRSYYTAFFVTRVLRQAGGKGTESLLGQVKQTLLARQVRAGRERGSWDPRDAYSDVGGPVYATSMAVLALKD
jgi:hypothetical protein